MKKIIFALLACSVFWAPVNYANETVEEQIEQLYQEFDQEMAHFVGVYLRSGSRTMLKRQYNRISQNYYASCNQQFDDNLLCKEFDKSFEAWFSIGDVIRYCSKNPRHCINKGR